MGKGTNVVALTRSPIRRPRLAQTAGLHYKYNQSIYVYIPPYVFALHGYLAYTEK